MYSFQKILHSVSFIPEGKVTTYGDIATANNIKNARIVGFALHTNSDPIKFPCHRVVKKDGSLASGYVFGGLNKQKRKLQLEGVRFMDDDKVDMDKCLYTFSDNFLKK